MTAAARVVGGEWQPLGSDVRAQPGADRARVRGRPLLLLPPIEGRSGSRACPTRSDGGGPDRHRRMAGEPDAAVAHGRVVRAGVRIVVGHVAGVMVATTARRAVRARPGDPDAVRAARGDDPVHRGRPADPVGMSDAGRRVEDGRSRYRPGSVHSTVGTRAARHHQRHGGAHDQPAGPLGIHRKPRSRRRATPTHPSTTAPRKRNSATNSSGWLPWASTAWARL